MRLMSIVSALLLCSAAPALAQRIQPDEGVSFALAAAQPDSLPAPAAFVVHYPVARHSLYGIVGGAAIAGSLAGILSVLCSSPECPRMGPAITWGAAFGALTGGAVGAVSGLNTPQRVPVTVASKSDHRSASR